MAAGFRHVGAAPGWHGEGDPVLAVPVVERQIQVAAGVARAVAAGLPDDARGPARA